MTTSPTPLDTPTATQRFGEVLADVETLMHDLKWHVNEQGMNDRTRNWAEVGTLAHVEDLLAQARTAMRGMLR